MRLTDEDYPLPRMVISAVCEALTETYNRDAEFKKLFIASIQTALDDAKRRGDIYVWQEGLAEQIAERIIGNK